MCVCARARGGGESVRGVEVIYTHWMGMSRSVSCTLPLLLRQRQGIAHQVSVDGCYCKCMTDNFRCRGQTHLGQVRVYECVALTQLDPSFAGLFSSGTYRESYRGTYERNST